VELNTSLPRVIAISIPTVFVVTTAGLAAFLVTCPSCELSLRNWLIVFFAANAIVLAVPGWIVTVFGLGRIMKNMFMMAVNVNDNFQDAHWTYHFNRLNLVFAPRYLNEYGLVARTKLFRGLLTFLLGIGMWVPLILIQELGVQAQL
jgi:hypothetical protein